jgi:gamma-glutamyl-gamma-aminobutyrate hydrolase PuuD
MKKLGITQRVEVIHDYGERRDCLDQQWHELSRALGYLCIPLPNIPSDYVEGLLDALDLDGLVLSGGNSLSSHEPEALNSAPERDRLESALIDQSIKRNIPLAGVCRGMQAINVHFGGDLSEISGHAGTRHRVTNTGDQWTCLRGEVNSYHNWAIAPADLADDLDALTYDSTGNIEAFIHKQNRISGIMWHPERETPFVSRDLELLTKFLS